jgi:hypothetical protein
MNHLVAELVLQNEKAFANIGKEELVQLIKNTSLCICLQNKSIKDSIQFHRITHAFSKFQNNPVAATAYNQLRADEDKALFNMLLIAEYKELIYESIHDFHFNQNELLERYQEAVQELCSPDELQKHRYDPEHPIFKGRKYAFYRLQKRGQNILNY